MISMALATPLLPFLPLTATQILLNNLLSDLPAMAISAAWRSTPSRLLVGATALVAGIAVALPWSGPLARTLGFVPLPLPLLAIPFGVLLAYVAASEWAKRWFFATCARSTTRRRKGVR